jgi:hypothetical protein
MQAAVQRHVDSAISKTVNVPEDIGSAIDAALACRAGDLLPPWAVWTGLAGDVRRGGDIIELPALPARCGCRRTK